MNSQSRSRTVLWTVVVLGMTVSSMAADQLSKEYGDRLERKIAAINENALNDPLRSKRTLMSDVEINSYLNFNIKEKIPSGLTNPEIQIMGNRQLAGRVWVDMDEFKRQRGSGGIMDPLSYVSGKVPLTARGLFQSQQGKGRFQLISAEILGVPLPKPIVQELVRFFSRTPQSPNGLEMDAPFNLPAQIREIEINPGEAVVVQ
jgi:hypothetical protein